jgi:curved DNA-binding protein CbpA
MEAPAAIDPYAVLQVVPSADHEVIRAAFRALANKFHPDRDGSEYAAQRMREINLAYAILKTPGDRAAFDRRRRMASAAADSPQYAGAPLAPPVALPSDASSAKLDFGRYAGWTLSQIARWDVDYLRWLSRHSAGIRHKHEIERLLKARGAASA